MIHQYKNNGYDIVMDVASGCVHVVDDVVYDAVELLEPVMGELAAPEPIPAAERERVAAILQKTYPAADVEEALDEVQGLIDAEELYTKDIYQNYVMDFKKRKTVVKALCLHIAHDCNLGCRYCFAEEGEYHGRRALMSYEVGKKALDFLIANSGNRRNLEVDFFGGEPLMNWKVVKQLVEYGRSQEEAHQKRFRFTLTTNGMLLNDEIMDFCNREMSNVVLSLDGRREVNDRMRPVRGSGSSSYDIIVPKFQKFAKSRAGKDYYVRGTFTRNNLDFCADVMHFADLGFDRMSVEPVVSDPTEPYAIREEDLPQILEEYDKLAKEYIKRWKEGRGFVFFHFMIDLNQGPCVAKRLSGCGSGVEYLAVTPWGDLYPCHQFVGQEEYLMGNVDVGIVRTDIRDEFKLCNVYAKEKCRSCFARFYCSGGCAANSYHFHGRITDAYEIGCEMQKKRIECAIMIQAALADDAEDPSMQGAKEAVPAAEENRMAACTDEGKPA
ncbi:MAG: thioether cross-link-forming SCIFF peptide maturase [Clostridiales bacterium]|nr:thioether cross-link-forming SCIFF peptide maturase [Clostridiales bacterium]